MALIQDQYSEDFDTNWPGAPWAANKYSNVVNAVSGWSISSNSISALGGTNYCTTLTNSCYFVRGGLSALTSPLLTNGIGAVIYDARYGSTATYGIFSLESSYDGAIWFTNSIVSNNVNSMQPYTNIVNSLSNQFFRFRRIDDNTTTFAVDTVRITYPTPVVTVSAPIITPLRPTDQDPVTLSANVTIQSVPDTFAMTNYWREWPATNWTLYAMTSNSPTLYEANSNIPAKPIGTRVESFARATYTADGAIYVTSSSTNAYVVIPKSSYTNLTVIGQLAASLRNGANYQWQGVIQVTNANPTFTFQGISNSVTNTWGELNQTVTNTPLYGQAEVTTNNITLYTTNTGYYLFSLTETNLDYTVRSCTYENFNIWTNADSSTPPHTNSTDWILFSGNTSNDTSRSFFDTGRSAIVETNGWLRSPQLTNGIGQISFWHRNWQTTGAPTGRFQIQTSSNNIDWDTLGGGIISNIVSTNYLFFSGAVNEIASKYVRILNTNTTARLCLDEVAIVSPGAVVSAARLETTPSTGATIVDPIAIRVELTPNNGATISDVTAWYRFGSNGTWILGAMTATDSVHYVLSSAITGAPVGELQYTVQYNFSGFQAPIGSSFSPVNGTNNPAILNVSEPVNNRQEDFDTNWPGAPWAANKYSNVVNTVSGWSISSNSISDQGGTNYCTTLTNSCYFVRGGLSALTSPLLTNGIGAVIYDARYGSTTTYGIFSLESSYDGSIWFTNSIVSNNVNSMQPYTNIVNSSSNQYFRFRRIDNNTTTFAIDTVRITYPPANVSITNTYINPNYPVAGQTFIASCDIASINPNFPAYNITTPVFYYWTGASAPTPVTMIPDGIIGLTHHYYTPSISLGTDARDKTYNYYISTTFEGYSASDAERQSPKNSITNTFGVRAYASDYQNITATVNGSNSTARLLTNGIWQTIFNVDSTNSTLSLALQGYGYSTGLGISASIVTWGNSNNWQTTLPLADYAGSGQTNITLTGGTFFGQYLVRFNELTLEYFVLPCVWQDFDGWTATNAYTLTGNSGLPAIECNFNDWTTNDTRTRTEDFSSQNWNNYTNTYTTGTSPNPENYPFYQIYGARVAKVGGAQGSVVQIQSNDLGFLSKRGWIAQLSTSAIQNYPLRGIGTISYKYRAATTNPPCTLGVYLFPTNQYVDESSYYSNPGEWVALTNHTSVVNALTNTAFTVGSISLNTNITSMVIFSHDAGDQNVYFDDLSVDEWYADTKTNANWIAYESWIETRPDGGNTCRFDPTRSTKTEQYLRTPLLTKGIDTITFDYCSGNNTAGQSITNTFEGWSTNSYGNYTYMNWIFINGRTASDKSYAANGSTNSAWLNGAPSSTNTSLCSPQLINGVRKLMFDYRNWNTSGTPTCALQVQGASSATPWIWTTITNLSTTINSTNYVSFTNNFVIPNYNYIRILNNPYGSNAPACIDNVIIDEAPATIAGRYITNSFDAWITASYGNYSSNNWVLTNGQSSADATRTRGGSGRAVWLNGTTGGTNTSLRSPYLNFGFQGVEFWYRNWETNASPAGKFLVQVAPSDTPASWVTIDTIFPIDSTNYTKYANTSISLTNHYVRIVNNPDGTNAAVCIDDISLGDFPYVSFDVQMSTNLITWTTLSTVSRSFAGGSATDYQPYTLYSPTNLSMYVRIYSKTPAPNILLVDDISITQFSRGENWIANNVNINKTPTNPFRQFVGGAGFLNSNRTSEVDALVDTNVCPYIQSPPLVAGIGEISFWYRNWAVSGSPAPTRLYIQKSSDSATWSTVFELPVESATNTADYRYFSGSIYDTNSHYVRISNNDTDVLPVGRVCIDNILVTTPLASSLTLSNLVIAPGIPLYSNAVKVAVEASRLFLIAPSNLTLNTMYGTGSTYAAMSSAGYASAPMTCVSTNLATNPRTYRYETTSGIPAMPADTFVKYEARASFSGYHPEIFSPTINKTLSVAPTWYAPLPSTGMAYYVVFSCPTGSVWINEINYFDYYTDYSWTNEYIELCGRADANLKNWTIGIYDANGIRCNGITVTNHPVLQNKTNGFGFWVLGDSGVANVDMVFTGKVQQFTVYDYADATNQNLPFGGGLTLTRGSGVLEQKISYGGGAVGFPPSVGSDAVTYDAGSLGLKNSGSNYNQFAWDELPQGSPGYINYGQTLLGQSEQNAPPPVVRIVSFYRDTTNVWIECISTNLWAPTPWYSTNLLNSNGWVYITTPFWSSYPAFTASNTVTLHFAPPTNNPVYFRVVATNTP
ncbi:MAG: hypothetical protein WCI03_03015 [bacterium]